MGPPPDFKELLNLLNEEKFREGRVFRKGALMEVTLKIPDALQQRLGKNTDDLPRWLLERAGLEAYKSGEISTHDLRLMLGFKTRMQLDGFLKAHGVFLDYTDEELAEEAETSRLLKNARTQ